MPPFNFAQGPRDSTKSTEYKIHQDKGDAAEGSHKKGWLLKRSEGLATKRWQRRRCEVHDGYLNIFHADESKEPTRVNLLTCQMKRVPDDHLSFHVISYNRTYHFQVIIYYNQCHLLKCHLINKQ